MKGYVWRIAFEDGTVRETTAPTITAAILMTASIWHQERVVSAVRIEEVPQTEEIPVSRVWAVTA